MSLAEPDDKTVAVKGKRTAEPRACRSSTGNHGWDAPCLPPAVVKGAPIAYK
ncbi:hypothetical protein L13192_09543 [Pyrenophora tritici-repentis]|uniref:Uncharacterized protein n=2 Tax=Pyrenophora tritici-repentis TaxID=45151 RepID=A0A922STP0_9PLEO|nr:uncharacterized protein PTRG_08167 [Pyrenophora tritici-repentis Pt-1C-BFP]EDU51086.1 predicted protein [Pyrenophora tritici-repentis Pt-1C-BFP]KAI1508435.1 hypothetical protein Ptr86124_012657 [Pyrenophora tritici-repentis]KAI1665859.1 hypothetical protein L13192_09543 [Pyrenophora tritici-repentis]KAI1678828.1 hypothetical protein KJE20_11010 [Pyrenophora tritici-repentis]